MFAKREEMPPAGVAAPGPPVGPGYVIGGTYRVERQLGQDAVGYVVAATNQRLKERVTLRFLRPAAPALAERAGRLLREARRAAQIDNEHLARVVEVGALGDGTPFFVNEYLEGRDLGARLREGVALHTSEAVEYIIQACAGLAETHLGGVVHRDLKPENLFLVRRPDGSPLVKVLGFGVSKLTPRGAQLPPFEENEGADAAVSLCSSPEQLEPAGRADRVDQRADIWSLGAVLFELLTGRPAFPASSLPELRSMVFEQPLPHASAFRPELPAGLDEAVTRCLARSPADRFQNVAELAFALLPFAPRRAGAVVERTAIAVGLTLTRLAEAQVPPAQLSGNPLSLSRIATGTGTAFAASASVAAPPVAKPAIAPKAASDEQKARRTLQIGTAVALLLIAAGVANFVFDSRQAGAPTSAAATSAVEELPPAAGPSSAAEAPPSSAPAADVIDTHGQAETMRAAKAAPHKARPVRSAPITVPPPRSPSDLEIRLKR